MKKLFLTLSVAGLLSFGAVNVFAQDDAQEVAAEQTEQVAMPQVGDADAAVEGQALHKVIKQKFIEGGVVWMTPILLCLILGLAIAIERVIYLNMSTVNTKKLIDQVNDALKNGGVEAAKEVCRNTRGPVASIFYEGLDRYNEGLEVVEKSVVSYGSVQMGRMENGLTWINLFIAVSPMLGFMGTIVGMIDAFDSIQAMGDISPAAVAGGIKIALLTTLAGLIAAVILQFFYNYIVSKIDGLVISMEDSSIILVDMLTEHKK